jgi:hypothetical protein
MAAHAFTDDRMIAQLRALAHAGHPASNIARVLNERFGTRLSPLAVRTKCVACGISLRRRKTAREVRFNADELTWRYLDAEAFRRGMTLARFCGLLLRLVAASNLAAAVLDDDGGSRGPSTDAREADAAVLGALAIAHPEKRRNGTPIDAAARS